MPPQPQNLLRRVRELTDGGYKIHAIELKPGKSVLVLRDEEKVAKNEAHRKKMLAIETQKPNENIDLTLADEYQQKLQESQQKYEESRRKLKVMAQELSDERKRASANAEETIAASRAKDQIQKKLHEALAETAELKGELLAKAQEHDESRKNTDTAKTKDAKKIQSLTDKLKRLEMKLLDCQANETNAREMNDILNATNANLQRHIHAQQDAEDRHTHVLAEKQKL